MVNLRDLSFAVIIKPLHTSRVTERALTVEFGDMNLFVQNWVNIHSYLYAVSPIAIVSQYKNSILIT
jgi:hypothetical protein